MNKARHILLLTALAFGACAGDVQPEGEVSEDFELAGGKADGGEDVAIRAVRGGSLVSLFGEPASGLWTILEDSGLRVSRTRSGLELVRTRSIACITNRSAAACQIFTHDASEVEGFDLAIHGSYSSSAADLYASIAAVTGASRFDTSVSYGDYLCERGRSAVWCGLRAAEEAETVELELSLSGLGDLGPDYVYEGWIITSDGPITSGRFDMESASETLTFDIDRALAEDTTLFVLTIEPAIGDDPAPADTHVVAGAFGPAGAELTTIHPAALGTDFTESFGAYILETPSSADPSDYNQGVWFVDPSAGAASLDLPTLPAGWAYEGWVVGEDGPVSTGIFLSTTGEDSDGAGPAAGPLGTPPFPGQDFIDPARDLLGGAVVISVEPVPDNSPAPFFLKPLVDGEVDDVGPGTLQDLGNNAEATAIFGFASFN
ncbi:MAG: anti-sigma factor [Myxococcota bacterium]